MKKAKEIPDKSIAKNGFGAIDYFDTYCIELITDNTVDAITTELFEAPKWVNRFMDFRNSIVRFWGLEASSLHHSKIKRVYLVGEKAIRFIVIDRSEYEIVMEKKDKHLDFRVSVFLQENSGTSTVYLSTLVLFNNVWGRVYFFLVKPFHRVMVKSILTRLEK